MRAHYDALAKSLASISLDQEVAADAAQEAFLELYLKWQGVDELANPVAWLYRVGINRCLDYRRRLARIPHLLDRLADARDAQTDEEWHPDPVFVAILKHLPRKQRVATVLYYQADFSTAEIARVMQISEGAVKSHLYRARETLRTLLEDE